MVRMLDDGQHTQACFVAHSLGTTAVSWMLHDTEGEELYWQYYTDSIIQTVVYWQYYTDSIVLTVLYWQYYTDILWD